MQTWVEKFDNWKYIRREVDKIRAHNCLPCNRHNTLLFSEGTAVCMLFERLLRIIPAIKSLDTETLAPLLNKALPLLSTPWDNMMPRQQIKQYLFDVRNGIMHGNWGKLSAPFPNKEKDYFFLTMSCDINHVYDTTLYFLDQINPFTGDIVPHPSTEKGNLKKFYHRDKIWEPARKYEFCLNPWMEEDWNKIKLM